MATRPKNAEAYDLYLRSVAISNYDEAQELVKRRPDSARAHFTLGYVLRYAGLLEDAAGECDAALALDPNNYTLRSCAFPFFQLEKYERAMDYVRLDAGSEWSSNVTGAILLRQGKLDEALQSFQRMSPNARPRSLMEACLQRRPSSEIDKISRETEARLIAEPDPEPKYYLATLLAFCGQREAALRLLRRAVEQNYCAYPAMDLDPLLAKIRGDADFDAIRSAAMECQNRFLAHRTQRVR
ncbi:MAG: tetratricopeptide repeat protein [Acidobacteria bacterium]|nr:tetratricopeptide repeat protein [Acidobacteriota bacterium]